MIISVCFVLYFIHLTKNVQSDSSERYLFQSKRIHKKKSHSFYQILRYLLKSCLWKLNFFLVNIVLKWRLAKTLILWGCFLLGLKTKAKNFWFGTHLNSVAQSVYKWEPLKEKESWQMASSLQVVNEYNFYVTDHFF